MRAKTKRSKKVHELLLYSTFKGNKGTIYGSEKEVIARQDYITHQRWNNHPNLSIQDYGIFISADSNWLAATPDGIVLDPSHSPSFCYITHQNGIIVTT